MTKLITLPLHDMAIVADKIDGIQLLKSSNVVRIYIGAYGHAIPHDTLEEAQKSYDEILAKLESFIKQKGEVKNEVK